MPRIFIWNKESIQPFQNIMSSPVMENELNKFLSETFSYEVNDVEKANSALTSLMRNCCRVSLKQKNHPRKKSNKGLRNKKWFDKECMEARKLLRSVSNKKHHEPNNVNLRIDHKETTKMFNSICHKKRNSFWSKKMHTINDNINTEEFWNTWKEMDENIEQTNFSDNKHGEVWQNYYQKLYTKSNNLKDSLPVDLGGTFENFLKQNKVNIPESKRVKLTNDCEKVLNKDIDNKELLNVVKRLKSKKAVALDLISNEMIKFSTSAFKNALIKLFNLILKSNHIPKGWSQGLITPVHKKGDKLNPDNYRGICITSCLGKVFFLILNDRLSKVVNKSRIIHDSQIGFKKGFRTADNLFTLNSSLNRHVIRQPKGKVYACFVDLKKAYDTVWHENLFMRLSVYGIDGNFLFILKKIYQQTKCAVKIGSKYTQFFEYKRGNRQGCPLSPILFNLYINDLAFALNAINPTPLKLNDMIEISCLFYADDIVILSSSPEGLQKCIECLGKLCESKALEVNNQNKMYGISKEI